MSKNLCICTWYLVCVVTINSYYLVYVEVAIAIGVDLALRSRLLEMLSF